ncbi:hypothetical protein BpHYR1_054679 [Brachionus plicatilis]|uniref:Uncharacterized protein n=1 Tax=Brachionus plicatilis TaxID=10195 RepID=A0A3M7SIT5_BRAPC|nr:hypothetical protein BpHYR1_054679 [Brachionus plicatilis]
MSLKSAFYQRRISNFGSWAEKKEVVEESDETSSETVTPSNFDPIGGETFEDTSFEIDEIAYVDLKIILEIKDFILSENCSKRSISILILVPLVLNLLSISSFFYIQEINYCKNTICSYLMQFFFNNKSKENQILFFLYKIFPIKKQILKNNILLYHQYTDSAKLCNKSSKLRIWDIFI